MARPLRIDYPGAWHHVMNRGARHQTIFHTDADRSSFLALLDTISLRFAVEINAYCLMGNHYHLLVHTPHGELSRAIHYLDAVYAQRFNRAHSVDGPLFRGRFLSKLVDSDGYCLTAATYIHRNPLETQLVERLLDYQWSSYPAFAGSTPRPNWLVGDALLIGGIRSPAQLDHATTGPDARTSAAVFSTDERVVGSDRFKSEALDRADDSAETNGQRRASRPTPTFDEVERAVAAELCVDRSRLRPATRGEQNDARLVAIGLAQQLGGYALTDIADRYDLISAKSAGSATARFRRRSASDGAFAVTVDRVKRSLDKGESETRPHSRERGK